MSFVSYKFLLSMLFVSLCNVYNVAHSTDKLPKYKIIDLGTLGMEESDACAVNEKGQVLGTAMDGGVAIAFLWDESSGLNLIDLPWPQMENFKFCNSGQFAGTYILTKSKRGFIWIPSWGFFDIGTLGGKELSEVVGINDKGQIVGYSKNEHGNSHVFFWDHAMTDLTEEFMQQIGSFWTDITVKAINNSGHVVICAKKYCNGALVTKSFLWKEGNFSMLLPKKDPHITVEVNSYDDNGNMIFWMENTNYFLCSDENLYAYLYHMEMWYLLDMVAIKNNRPYKIDSLLGEIKEDSKGQKYFAPGIKIHKLLVEEYPFYDVGNRKTTTIRDQNSKGYVVGKINTVHSNQHAFLAVPSEE